MTFTDTDISIFAGLINANDISVAEVINWAYAQYTDDGVEPWIEDLALALDKTDVLEILSNNFNVCERLSRKVMAGKFAHAYFQQRIDLKKAIWRILDILEDVALEAEKQRLYIADDFFDWHQNPEAEALNVAKPVLEKYAQEYERSRRMFCL